MIGWIGCLCFCTCALPQVIKCIKTGNASDFSIIFLLLWLLGEICYIISVGLVYWLLLNYICNLIFVLIIIYYRIFK